MEISKIIAIHEARHRKSTRGVNRALLQHLTEFVGGTLFLSDITEDFCVSFAEFLLNRLSVNSARTYLHKLHAILEHAISDRLLPYNPMPPFHVLIPGYVCPPRTYLTKADVERLNRTLCRHDETKRAFLFACQTGLRLSDIETLKWSDIISVSGTPTIVKTQIKTGCQVRIPLNCIARGLLGDIGVEGLVFRLKSRSVISADLRQWAKDAGLDKRLTFHVSRHTFATLSISAGVDIYVVSKLCGHSTVKTTEIYAHMVDNTLLQGVNKLGNAMGNGYPAVAKKRLLRLSNKIQRLRQKMNYFLYFCIL